MKEIPIIFSTPMVQAILDRRKTQTRRVFKLNHHPDVDLYAISEHSKNYILSKSPYGQPGDLLWVREAFLWVMRDHAHDLLVGSRDGNQYAYKASCHEDWIAYAKEKYGYKWKPSIHMSKDAARIWLKVVNVRVERLQDIKEQDAIAEGVEPIQTAAFGQCWGNYGPIDADAPYFFSPVHSFMSLWESINGVNPLKQNPWVWVIEFEVVSKNGRP